MVVFLRGFATLLHALDTERKTSAAARATAARLKGEADLKFRTALRLNPIHPVIQREAGFFFCRYASSPGTGRSLLAQAIRLWSEDPQLHYYLAELAYVPAGSEPRDVALCAGHLSHTLRDPRAVAPRFLQISLCR